MTLSAMDLYYFQQVAGIIQRGLSSPYFSPLAGFCIGGYNQYKI